VVATTVVVVVDMPQPHVQSTTLQHHAQSTTAQYQLFKAQHQWFT